MPCRIELADIELMLHIGCTEEERASPQLLRFRMVVRSVETFPASRTDELQDTLDVKALRDLLITSAEKSRVRTLERLGQLLESGFRQRFSMAGCEWEIAIEKTKFGWSYVHAWSS